MNNATRDAQRKEPTNNVVRQEKLRVFLRRAIEAATAAGDVPAIGTRATDQLAERILQKYTSRDNPATYSRIIADLRTLSGVFRTAADAIDEERREIEKARVAAGTAK